MSTILGTNLKNMPWEDKPAEYGELMWRFSGNPVTVWNMSQKMARVYNSAVVPFEGAFAGVFRADHKDGKARIHAGFSMDAVHWNIENDEIEWKDEQGNAYQPNYAYDPRVVKIDETYYIVWCTDFGGGAALGFGCTKDFKTFTRLENITIPFNRNGVPFPRKVNGKYLMLSRPSDSGHTPFGDIFISESPDLVHWGRHRKVMSKGASGWWQGVKIGAGPIPIETKEGWLLFYHGVSTTCNGFVYSMGAALLDIDEPSKVLYRTRNYLLTPEEPYETTGFVPNVVFPCATLHDADTGRIAVYYGAADTYTGIAFCKADEIIEDMKQDSDLAYGDDVCMR